METLENITNNKEKTKAWIKPTNISIKIKGMGIKIGMRKYMTVKSTSPAKTLPKRRKENDRIFDNSERISRIPTKNAIGEEKFINL
jgi:hypothetical protein